MLTSFLFIILAFFVEIFLDILRLIPVIIPEQVTDALALLANNALFFGGVVNFAGVIPPLVFFLEFLLLWYTFRTIMWAYHLLPHPIGKKDEMHRFSKKSTD